MNNNNAIIVNNFLQKNIIDFYVYKFFFIHKTKDEKKMYCLHPLRNQNQNI